MTSQLGLPDPTVVGSMMVFNVDSTRRQVEQHSTVYVYVKFDVHLISASFLYGGRL